MPGNLIKSGMEICLRREGSDPLFFFELVVRGSKVSLLGSKISLLPAPFIIIYIIIYKVYLKDKE